MVAISATTCYLGQVDPYKNETIKCRWEYPAELSGYVAQPTELASRERGTHPDFGNRPIRLRAVASGSKALPACKLSRTCSGFLVPGITQVTAGCPNMNFRKYLAQLLYPKSWANGGRGLPRIRVKSSPLSKGRLTITATFLS